MACRVRVDENEGLWCVEIREYWSFWRGETLCAKTPWIVTSISGIFGMLQDSFDCWFPCVLLETVSSKGSLIRGREFDADCTPIMRNNVEGPYNRAGYMSDSSHHDLGWYESYLNMKLKCPPFLYDVVASPFGFFESLPRCAQQR